MDCHFDYTIKLNTETEHSSLYKWCLQEIDRSGEQVGRDLIPWVWPLEFDVTEIRHTYTLKHDDPKSLRFDRGVKETKTDEPNIEFNTSEGIYATLIPAEGRRYGRTSYSMIGTKRAIKDIRLRIEKAESDSCRAWGAVSQTFELDFEEETTQDNIMFLLRLTPVKFDELARKINSVGVDGATLQLSGVWGFYSDWSPELSTGRIKVLTSIIKDHVVEVEQDADLAPPRLGEVQEFQFWLSNNHRLTSGDENDAVDYGWAKNRAEAEVRSVSEDDDSEDDDDRPIYTMNEERATALRRTNKYRLLIEMHRELSCYSANKSLGPDAIDDLSNEIMSFFTKLGFAFQRDNWTQHEDDPAQLTKFYEREWQLWMHQQVRFDEIKKGEVPHIDRRSLTEAVARYLDLPVRNRDIDRMLVDALVAAEVIAFADQMLNIPSFLKDLSASPFVKSHPLWRFIKGQLASFGIFVGFPISVLIGAVDLFDVRGEWPFFTGLGFAGLWSLFFLSGLIALPGAWASETRGKRKVAELLEAMRNVYTEIEAGTIVSARHIRERLDKTSEQGAVWPSEVFPLLDDIIDRGGVM